MIRNLEIFKYVVILFLIWRSALFLITFLGLSSLPNFDFYNKVINEPNPNLSYITRWANWDGKAYIDLSKDWYFDKRLTVFFPLYPLLIRFLTFFNISAFISGFLLSQIFTIFSMFFFLKLSKLDFNDQISKKALFSLLIFPSSFYLVSLYAESLTLLLILMAFYLARIKKWYLAVIILAFSSVSRPYGLITIISVVFEYLITNQYLNFSFKKIIRNSYIRFFLYILGVLFLVNLVNLHLIKEELFFFSGVISSLTPIIQFILFLISLPILKNIFYFIYQRIDFKKILSKNFLFLLFSFIPVILYLTYLNFKFGSPFIFIEQEAWWGKFISYPWSAPISSLIFFIENPLIIGEYSAKNLLRLGVLILLFITFIISLNKLRISYIIFFGLTILLSLSSGTLIDLPRYSLLSFPMFLILGNIKNELLQSTYFLVSTLLLAFLSILFINAYFFM